MPRTSVCGLCERGIAAIAVQLSRRGQAYLICFDCEVLVREEVYAIGQDVESYEVQRLQEGPDDPEDGPG